MQRQPPTKPPRAQDKIEVESGAEKRLANILKKALNTPPKHRERQGEAHTGEKANRKR